MAIEIVSFPSYKMVIFHSYVSLSEGIWGGSWIANLRDTIWETVRNTMVFGWVYHLAKGGL